MKWADIVGLTPPPSAGRKQQVQDVVQQDVGHATDEARMGAAFKSVKDVIHAALEKAKEKEEKRIFQRKMKTLQT